MLSSSSLVQMASRLTTAGTRPFFSSLSSITCLPATSTQFSRFFSDAASSSASSPAVSRKEKLQLKREKRLASEAEKKAQLIAATSAASLNITATAKLAEKKASSAAATTENELSENKERTVPLNDLSGIDTTQNKFADILALMEKNGSPSSDIEAIRSIGSYLTANNSELLSARLANLRQKYQRHPTDTGSAEVQIVMMTERLKNYENHRLNHKKDKSSLRGIIACWHNRRKMLKYLRRTNFQTYAYIMKELNLREFDIDNVGIGRAAGMQRSRIKED